ncbi:AAA family ATPase [Acidianus sulfidivorans JP7]|uniref:ATPase n=1 Tax=Acidianus sulfidivorans JP7 TaxID=619593 RepID=A0A2U9IJK8_9CREN|nr:ATP-binding protein [Acidianus sulfidivorans]AWR96228.1 AAA family ATPase [Acidianus sulfidivorans JP7]
MLFDERPKTKREDLFDRKEELNELEKNIDKPLILLTGIRRIGKTSLLQVFLHENNSPFILIDCRKLKENYGWKDLYDLLSRGMNSRVIEFLKGIKGIRIMNNEIEISWKGKNFVSLSDLFDYLNKKRLIIAFDEAQRLRGPLSKEIKDAFAHAYDYDNNLTFILTGSEVGLLYDFIGIEDSSSPLYGRLYHEIKVERFSKDVSFNFLRKGFEEYSMKVKDEVIEEIVSFFDGIPGWLAISGNLYVNFKDIEKIKEIAVNIALNELKNLIRNKIKISKVVGRRYLYTLKCIAEENNSWSKLERCLSDKEGSTISSSVLSNILKQLEYMSLIKDYSFLDPIYKEASKKLSI